MKRKIEETRLLTGKHNNVNDKRNSVCNDDRICTKATKKSVLVIKQRLLSLMNY